MADEADITIEEIIERGFVFDETSADSIIFEGADLKQLSNIFRMDKKTIQAKLQGNVEPVAKRGKAELFNIREAAAYLVTPPYDIDEFIRKMTTVQQLPFMVRKEFWAGMRSKQAYEKDAAELWPTTEVEEILTKVFLTTRQSLLISREIVERETELTAKQRKLIIEIIDNTLNQIYDRINDSFPITERDIGLSASSGQDAEIVSDEDL